MPTNSELDTGITLGWIQRKRHGRRPRANEGALTPQGQASPLTVSRFEHLLLERLAALERHRVAHQPPPKLEW